MLRLQFFFILLLCLAESKISSERDQVCQVKVIRECLDHSLGLLEAMESRNERMLKEKCDSLQVRPGLRRIAIT